MIPDEIARWVEATADGRIVGVERPPTGGSRALFFVEVEHDGARTPLVLRLEEGGGFSGTEVSVAREAAVYRALAGTGVPVPAVVGVAPDGRAVLLERLRGTGELNDLDVATRAAAIDDFVDALAALHSLDVGSLPLGDAEGFPRPLTPEDHARFDLAVWGRLAREHIPDLDPLARFAAGWLHAHAPTQVPRTVLVHGDVGPGNFVAEAGRVTGMVDWEFAHFGDPMDDLAWFEMRSGGRGVGDLGPYLARWEAASGLNVDDKALDFYRVDVQYRCAVTTSLAVRRGGGARGWAPYLLVTQRYLLGLVAALETATAWAEPAPSVPGADATPRGEWFDTVLTGVRAAVHGLTDLELREQTRNLIIPLQYLKAYDRIGAELDALDRDDRATTFAGSVLGTTGEAEFADAMEAAGRSDDERAFRYLARRTRRTAALWAELLERRR